ncbi:MAG: hypothetical protein LBC39_02740 [Methanobrevibacter sp.]|jgi:hypothetical protein|nr:hypothetical protein [Candidatus Methanovirga aequatorialis]
MRREQLIVALNYEEKTVIKNKSFETGLSMNEIVRRLLFTDKHLHVEKKVIETGEMNGKKFYLYEDGTRLMEGFYHECPKNNGGDVNENK